MKPLNKRQSRKPNLLELSSPEKVLLIKKARKQLKQTIIEAKLWQSLLEVENLAVNGNTVYDDKQPLRGFCLENMV